MNKKGYVIGMSSPLIPCLFVIAMVLSIGIIVLSSITKSPQYTYACCCDNKPCTDTYYNVDDNTCHLILCEHNLFLNRSECIYKAKCPTTMLAQT